MRWVLLSFLFCFLAHADKADDVALTQFGHDYAAAIHSQKIEQIKPFFHPALLTNLSPKEKKIVDDWFTSACTGPATFAPPVQVQIKKLTDFHFPPEWGKWRVPPQYQIILQGVSTPAADGSRQGQFMMDFVAEKEGHFYIVRPFPNGPLPPPTVVAITPTPAPSSTPPPVPTPH